MRPDHYDLCACGHSKRIHAALCVTCRRAEDAAESDRSLMARLMEKIAVSETGCWLWTGTTSMGYGHIYAYGNRHAKAHRVLYELMVGPIPAGLDIDHLCRVRSCVNPTHLEPVTLAENNRRAAAARTDCPHGHPLDGLRRAYGVVSRYCRTCNQRRAHKNRQLAREAA